MIWSAGNFGMEIDLGPDKPKSILQLKEKGYRHDYLINVQPVTNPFKME